MPDLDIIDRNAPRGWSPPLRLLLGAGTPEEVADATIRACAKSMRENGGLPAFDDFVTVLRRRERNQLDSESAFTLLDSIAHRVGHTRHVDVAARAAKRLLVELGRESRPGDPIPERFARAFLNDFVEHALFGRVGPDLGKHYKGPEEACRRSLTCKGPLSEPLKELARQLVADPTGKNVRARRLQLVSRRSTGEILTQPIM